MVADPTTRDFAPLKHVRAILAKCPAFQTLVGAAGESAALETIHYHARADAPVSEGEQEPQAAPAYAVVGANDTPAEAQTVGPQADFSDAVGVLIQMPVTGETDAECFAQAEAAMGDLREQFFNAAKAYGFRINGLPQKTGPYLSDENERGTRGDYAEMILAINYFDTGDS